MSTGPTTGASEADSNVWYASPLSAWTIRLAAFLLPLGVSLVAVRLVADVLWRPDGWFGFTLWIVQVSVVGLVVSMAVDRITKKMLPLAALLNMTLVFPDEAPSRFSVALKAGSARKLRAKANAVTPLSDATNPNEAATAALALVSELALHDRKTRGHTERVRAYSDLIGAEMGLTEDQRIRLSWAGLLHDVGKMTVPSEILNKRGRPDETEWAILSSHPAAGGEMLAPLADWLGDWVLAAAQHHERWDGDGYPLGLKGEEISLAGRIVAVADAFDVITSKRSYKNPMSHEAARKELVACSGTQFDPVVVRSFLNVSLGRRWLVGPFAWLAELPLGSVGGSVARIPMAAAGALVAVTSVTVPAQPGPRSDDLAFVPSSVVPSTTAPATIPPGASTTAAAPTTTTRRVAVTTTINPDTSTTQTSVPPDAPTSTTTTSTVPANLVATTTTAPTSLVPTTVWSFPTTTTTTIAPTTTTTMAPTTTTTTTAPTTTTTTAPTTTTTTTTTTAPTTTTTTIPPGSPMLSPDTIEVRDDRQINIHVLDNDDSGNSPFDQGSLEIVSDPLHASTIEIHNDHVHYKSVRKYSGTDTFDYRICNDNGLCSIETVVVTVT